MPKTMVIVAADELTATVQRWRTRWLADQLHVYHGPADSKESAVFATGLYRYHVMIASMFQAVSYAGTSC